MSTVNRTQSESSLVSETSQAEKIRWSISIKLFLICAFLLSNLLGSSVMTYLQINEFHAKFSDTSNDIAESMAFREIQVNLMSGFEAEVAYVGLQEESVPQEIAGAETAWNKAMTKFDALNLDESEKASLQSLKTLLGQTAAAFDQTVKLVKAGDIKGAEANHTNVVDPLISKILALYDDQIDPHIAENTKLNNQYFDQMTSRSGPIILGFGLLAIVIGSIAAYFVVRSITNPVNHLTNIARAITRGNLDVVANVSGRDETGVLAIVFNQMTARMRYLLRKEQEQREYLQSTIANYADHLDKVAQGNLTARVSLNGQESDIDDPLVLLGHNLNDMTASLQHMISQIRETANGLSSAASEILAATTQQMAGANEQSAAISQTTTTVDEVKAISEQSVERSLEVVNVARHTADISQSGQNAVQETIESMGQIKERVEGIAENVVALSERTRQIGEIIAMVNEISTQSNMLALNASVEAARAGEYGKGFGAVAGEVRSLATQAKQATSQVSTILQDIQNAINAAVMSTEEGTKVVDTGVKLAAQSGEVIIQLGSAIQQSSQTSAQVVAGGRQQASGMEQVALAMQNINQATQQSLASTRQAEKAAQDLNHLAGQLNDLVKQYQAS